MPKWAPWIPPLLFYALVSSLGLAAATGASVLAGFVILVWQRLAGIPVGRSVWITTVASFLVGGVAFAVHSALPIAMLNMAIALGTGAVALAGALVPRIGLQGALAAQVTADPNRLRQLRAQLRLAFGTVGGLWVATAALFLAALPGGNLVRLRLVSDLIFGIEVLLFYLWVSTVIRRTAAHNPPPMEQIPTGGLIKFYRRLDLEGRSGSDAAQRTLKEIERRTGDPQARAFLDGQEW